MIDSFKVFNSLGKKKEVFYTNKKSSFNVCCGPTVYDLLHVGNFRNYIFLIFLKSLEHKGYKVNYIVTIQTSTIKV